MASSSTFDALEAFARDIAACRVCIEAPRGKPLPHEPRPVVRPSSTARLLVAGQAPGIRVHTTGKPFNDPSGDRLRQWMGIDRETFYDRDRIAIAPMGFCFPGWTKDKRDLPPRRECRDIWHDRLFSLMPQIEVVLAIGAHAHAYHLARLGHGVRKGEGMTELVRRFRDFAGARPRVFPLPHPSWRNSGWLKRHPWFEAEVLPELREAVKAVLGAQNDCRPDAA